MYTKPKGMQAQREKRVREIKEEREKTKRGGINREEGEGLPRDSSFGYLCYQFPQKCQCTVTFFPTASPAPTL